MNPCLARSRPAVVSLLLLPLALLPLSLLPMATSPAAATPTSPDLDGALVESVPEPDLEAVDAGVRERLRAAMDKARAADPEADAEAAATAWGELGSTYLHFGFYDAAGAALENAVALRPEEPAWRYYLAVASMESGELEKAVRHLRRVATSEEGNLPAVLRLAQVLRVIGTDEAVDEARILYEAALQSPLGEAAGHAGLGRIALDRGEPAKAVEHLEKALEAQPEATALHYSLGLAYREAGQTYEAQEHLEAAGDVEVSFPDPWMIQLDMAFEDQLADVEAGAEAARRGELDDAEARFRAALEADPDDVESRRVLADLLLERGELEEAREELEEALRRSPRNAGVHLELAEVLAASGAREKGLDHLRQAVEIDPEFRRARILYGRALLAEGRSDEAVEQVQALVELDPREPDYRLQLGRVLLDLGRLEEAETAMDAMIEALPAEMDGVLLRGLVRTALGDEAGARDDFERVTAASVSTPGQKAQAHYRLGLFEENGEAAEDHFRNALVHQPGHRPAAFALAELARRDGRLDEASALYRRLLERDPDDLTARLGLARLLTARGDLRAAEGHWEILRQARPQVTEIAVEAAVVQAGLGRFDEATTRLRRLIDEGDGPRPASERAAVLHALGTLHTERPESAGATEEDREIGLDYLRRAVDADPDAPTYRRSYAEALARLGRYDAAAEEFAAYLDAVPGDHETRLQATMALLFAERHAEARDLLAAGTAESASVPLTHLLARVLAASPDPEVRNGERALSIARAVFAAERNPAHGETLAMAHAAAGDFERAVELQERLLAEAEAVDFDPGFVARVRANLERYRRGEAAPSIW